MSKHQYLIANTDQLKTAFKDAAERLAQGTALVLEWKVSSGRRSINQNALFHTWCGQIASQMYQKTNDDTYNKQTVKLFLKKQFLGTEDIVVGKQVIESQVRSSSKLDKGEMFNFMEKILAFAHHHNFVLSRPEDSEFEQLREMNE